MRSRTRTAIAAVAAAIILATGTGYALAGGPGSGGNPVKFIHTHVHAAKLGQSTFPTKPYNLQGFVIENPKGYLSYATQSVGCNHAGTYCAAKPTKRLVLKVSQGSTYVSHGQTLTDKAGVTVRAILAVGDRLIMGSAGFSKPGFGPNTQYATVTHGADGHVIATIRLRGGYRVDYVMFYVRNPNKPAPPIGLG